MSGPRASRGGRGWVAVAAIGALVIGMWTMRGPPAPSRPPGISHLDHDESLTPVPVKTSARPESDTNLPPEQVTVFRAGEQVTVSPSEAPAQWLLRGQTTGNETHYRRLVADLAGDGVYLSVDLGRAAREFVFQYTELGMNPPTDVRNFLLGASGAVAADTSFQHVRTNSIDGAALRTSIMRIVKDPPDGDGPLILGVGEVFTPGRKTKRHIGVVGTRLPVRLRPMPRSVKAGSKWTLDGTLLVPFSDLRALVLRPGGSHEKLPVQRRGDHISVSVPVGSRAGEVIVQLVGDGPRGPGKLFQAKVYVDQPPPSSYKTTLPVSEAQIQNTDDAARWVAKLVNRDRARHGLAPLRWDQQLADISREHSVDMRDGHFFSHRSPTTGLHTERLAKAGYRAGLSAENLALNVSLQEAEAGLMDSLGHRLNLLHPLVTHLGVGVAGEELGEGQRRWWVTQLFARPTQRLDPRQATRSVMEAIVGARRATGVRPVDRSGALDGVAADALSGGVDDLDSLLKRALATCRGRGLAQRRTRAWAGSAAHLEDFDLPGFVRSGSLQRIGLALSQADDAHGTLTLVLLAQE